MTHHDLDSLLGQLRSLPAETEWVEFKHNNCDPNEIGQYLSAIANSAALHGLKTGYVVWGIEDGTHHILGTSFRPREMKVKGQDLETWLLNCLQPRIDFKIHEFTCEGLPVVLFEIQAARTAPIRFNFDSYIRVGSNKLF